MISIIDYGVGNLKSLQNAFDVLNYDSKLIRSAKEILQAEKLVLPGVGAIAYAMENIQRLNLEKAIKEKAISGQPILGICLGMQLFFTTSYEGGNHTGLNLIPGEVKLFKSALKVPHMGWNEIQVKQNSVLFNNLPATRFGYFVHSYYCVPAEADAVIASTDYGINFASVVEMHNIYGVQFHPEKSQELGLQILKNFAEI